jgi:4'-phosphopantetheinyl transferase
MVAHGAVRTIVGRRLGLQPRQVPWTAGHNGKPALTDGPDEVSLSHSGDLAVLAISRRGVGVDVEQITPGLETAALARRFSPAEAAGLQAMPAARRAPAFTAMWTRKEALVKAAGSRLGHGLGVEIDHDAVVRLPGDRRRHRVRDLPDIPLLPGDRGDYRAAVALAGVSPYHVRVHHWNAEENL